MHKYKMILEYDGTNYRGWQTQKNAKSIQETLIAAAQKFLGEPVDIQGAGRTDAGVHALAQAAHLETSREVDPEALRAGINDNLPETINVLSCGKRRPAFPRPPSRGQPELSLPYFKTALRFRQAICLVDTGQA